MRRRLAVVALVASLAAGASSCVSVRVSHEAGTASANDGAEARAIREVRLRSNRALVARDLATISATLAPDVEVTVSTGQHASGRDTMLARFEQNFRDSAFDTFVRTTDSVTVSSAAALAAEHGHWTGRWRRADGTEERRGSYFAQWRKTDAGWVIRAEIFVLLSCSGSASCPGL